MNTFTNLVESEAIHLAQEGNAQAFEFLYCSHVRRVYRVCFRMVANQAEAEDLTQEVFLQVFRKIGTFRGESALSTWLYRMAVNVVLMRMRKKKTMEEVPLDNNAGTEKEVETPEQDRGAPDPCLVGLIDRVTLQAAVAQLAPGYRIIFTLHDVEGYKHEEIAEILGCSPGNSKSQLNRARMKLRWILRPRRVTPGNGRSQHRKKFLLQKYGCVTN